MKKIILVLLTILLCSNLYAHDKDKGRRGKSKGPENHINRLTESLDLSEDQVGELKTIFDNARSNCSNLEKGKMHDCMRSQKGFIQGQLYSLLDENQKVVFEEVRKERGHHKGGKGHRKRGHR